MRAYVRRLVNDVKDGRALSRLDTIPIDTSPLAPLSQFQRDAAFSTTSEAEWLEVEKSVAPLGITTTAGGVNPGDRRALYYLIRYLQPRSVLEVGTHIGASTVHIASALKALRATGSQNGNAYKLTTVDIIDVNDETSKPWKHFGSTYAPIDMITRLDCEDLVTFHSRNSLDYLAGCEETYDLIFLDDNHDGTHVYQEIPLALRLLNPGGFILLHDFFPDNRPLWSNRKVVKGPWLATNRFRTEGADIDVLPLGALPWPTKLGSNVTSLAILGRR